MTANEQGFLLGWTLKNVRPEQKPNKVTKTRTYSVVEFYSESWN
jgi:hypothetical protein